MVQALWVNADWIIYFPNSRSMGMVVVGVVVGDGVGPVGTGVVGLTSHSPNTLVSKESIMLLKSSMLKTFLSLDATRYSSLWSTRGVTPIPGRGREIGIL